MWHGTDKIAPHALKDECVFCIHLLVLGTGHRLFAEGFAPATFDLVSTTPTTTGVMLASYQSIPRAGASPGTLRFTALVKARPPDLFL